MRRNVVKKGPGFCGGDQVATEREQQQQPCGCCGGGGTAGGSIAIKPTGTVTGGMSTDGSRITPEGSQKLTLLAEGSPPQMMKGGGGGVRTHGGIDRPGNKNTTAMSQGNSKKMGRNNNNNNIGKHDILEHPNTEKFKEQEELDYTDDVRGSCVPSTERNISPMAREGSNLDLDSYFLSHSMQYSHERIAQPSSIRLKEAPHIKHHIQSYLEKFVQMQAREAESPSQLKPQPSAGDGTTSTGLSLPSFDNVNEAAKSQMASTAATTTTSQLEPSLMATENFGLKSVKEELEEIELKEVEILAEQEQLRLRKQKLLQNCSVKGNRMHRASVYKYSPLYRKHYYSFSVSGSGPQSMMTTSDPGCPPPPLSHHLSSTPPTPSPLGQSVQHRELHTVTYPPPIDGGGGSCGIGTGVSVKQNGRVTTNGTAKPNELLNSTSRAPFSDCEMELADITTSASGLSSPRSIVTSGDTISWDGDSFNGPSSPSSSTFMGQTSLIIPRVRCTNCPSSTSSQEGSQISSATSVSSMKLVRSTKRPFQSCPANSKVGHYLSNRRGAFSTPHSSSRDRSITPPSWQK